MQINLNKSTLIIEGLIFLVLGVIAAMMPVLTALSVVIIIGGVVIIVGIIQFIRVLQNIKTVYFLTGFVSATLAVIIGVLMLIYPMQGFITIGLLIGIWFMFHGILQIGFAIQAKKSSDNWGLMVLAGVISIILSFIMWSGWPLENPWVIGLILGAYLMFLGGAILAFGLKLHPEASKTKKVKG